MLDLIAFVTDAVILTTYFLMARGRPALWFHWANALGCIPLLVVEATSHAWPVMPLTAAFGLIGWAGVLHKENRP